MSYNKNSRRLSYDNPNLFMSEKIVLRLQTILPYIAFAFLGTILITATYAILFFFKDLYITWAKKDDRGFFYKFVNLKPHVKYISYFAFIIAVFWVVVLFLEWRRFILISGFLLFLAGYIIIHVKYYLIDDNDFDYFDEFVWFYHKIRKTKPGKVKTD